MNEIVITASADGDSEDAQEEKLLLTPGDLEIINEAHTGEVLSLIKEEARFMVTARRKGLTVERDTGDAICLTLTGPTKELEDSFDEAEARGWETYWDGLNGAHTEFYTYPQIDSLII